jgi:hypothetical protein
VHACNDDGDRLQKSEFWCIVCLQWAVVDSSGLVTDVQPEDEDTGPGGTALCISDPSAFAALTPRLSDSLLYEMAQAQSIWETRSADLPGSNQVDLDLVRLATALAIRAVGSEARMVELVASNGTWPTLVMVHPALVQALAHSPTIA